MIIVGIGGFFHDFNACAVDLSSGSISAAEEERFSRKKHHPILGASESSIDCLNFTLAEIGAQFSDVNHVVFSDLEEHPLKATLRSHFPAASFHNIHHHLCHAGTSYYCSSFEEAAIVILDGFGDNQSGLLAVGRGPVIEPIRYLDLANSIGLEFLRVTYQIGLGSFGSEGKTQGLAAYGTPQYFDDYLQNVRFLDDGTFELSDALRNMEGYLAGEMYLEVKSLFNDFIAKRITRRFPDEELQSEHMNMAASVQELLNAVGIHCCQKLREESGCSRVVVGGGVALNSTLNGLLRREAGFDELFTTSNASDRGNGLGAALYFINNELQTDFRPPNPFVYGGQSFSRDEIEIVLNESGVKYERTEHPDRTAAKLISDGLVVGWFQGRSELGARALGNRSILADPRKAENKDILNHKVKHREWFRPFAPAVLHERAEQYFDLCGPVPQMTETVPVREEARAIIPACVHEDGTARVQTVIREMNEMYYSLIEHFGELTGVPIVINTSFNVAGEPIVETPKDAVECYLNTSLDALIIGDAVAVKEDSSS